MNDTRCRRILIIDGHPDPASVRFSHALVCAYQQEAIGAGHEVRSVRLANLALPMLRTQAEFESTATDETVTSVQANILWCDHLVIVYPLWLGSMPALLKGLFEQVFRPGFAFSQSSYGCRAASRLAGKSARIIVTMGMLALNYRWYFGAHSLKCLKRNILSACGIGPIRSSVIGGVGGVGVDSAAHHERWIKRIRRYAKKRR